MDVEAQPMQAITLQQAQQNLADVIANVVAGAEPIIICTDAGQQVVCLPLDEFNSWKETLHLLSNPVNAAHLRRSLAEAGSACQSYSQVNLLRSHSTAASNSGASLLPAIKSLNPEP
jgi:antitoxin YefM